MADKERSVRVARLRISGLLEIIGRLGQGPDVVLGDQTVGSYIGSATVARGRTGITLPVVIPVLTVVHLVVEGLCFVVPHLQQPVDSKPRFVGEVR